MAEDSSYNQPPQLQPVLQCGAWVFLSFMNLLIQFAYLVLLTVSLYSTVERKGKETKNIILTFHCVRNCADILNK